MFKRIMTAFSCTRSGLAQANYAADMSGRLHGQLWLAVPGLNEDNIYEIVQRLSGCCCRKVGPQLKRTLSAHEARLIAPGEMRLGAGDLLIGGDRRLMPATTSWLQSYDEEVVGCSSLPAENGPSLLIPFGDRWETMAPALRGLDLVRLLNGQAVFYHTTWREDSLGAAAPEEHMCASARQVRDSLYREAGSRNVPQASCQTVVECADDVAQGTVRAALRFGCSLIIMARGKRTVRGSYVDQVVGRSTVPVLVFGREDKGGLT